MISHTEEDVVEAKRARRARKVSVLYVEMHVVENRDILQLVVLIIARSFLPCVSHRKH